MKAAVALANNSRLTPELLWQDIVRLSEELRLPPGGQLPSVRNLADKLAAKPTLIRDALLYAQARGAVRIVPRVGAFLETSSTAARALTGELIEAVPRAIHATVSRRRRKRAAPAGCPPRDRGGAGRPGRGTPPDRGPVACPPGPRGHLPVAERCVPGGICRSGYPLSRSDRPAGRQRACWPACKRL